MKTAIPTNQPWRLKAARDLCAELNNAGLRWVDPPGEARGFDLLPKAVWEALVSERVKRGELLEALQKLHKAAEEFAAIEEDQPANSKILGQFDDAMSNAEGEIFRATLESAVRS